MKNSVKHKSIFILCTLILTLLSNNIFGQQTISCNGINYEVLDEKVSAPSGLAQINVRILRCENNILFAEMETGGFKLLLNDTWTDIKQLITIGANSYYLKPNGEAFNASDNLKIEEISGIEYLVSNDKKLVAIKSNNFYRLEGSNFVQFTPNYVPEQLTMNDEGLWFFIQSRTGYEKLDVNNREARRNGLTLDTNNNTPIVETIPLTGQYDKFLWRVKKITSDTYELINKNGSKLKLGNKTQFKLTNFNTDIYGTTAYRIQEDNLSLSYKGSSNPKLSSDTDSVDQVWLFHFNQMVSEYMLPRNENIEPDRMTDYFDRALKGLNNTTFLATKTTSDWALVNTYFIQTNIINAIKNQDWIKGDPNNTSKGKGITRLFTYVINKNDTQEVVGRQDFNRGIDLPSYRGGADGGNNYIFTSEEFMCRKGVTHLPNDNEYREFDHPVHEFFHILENRLGPVNKTFKISKNQAPFVVDARNTLTKPLLNFRDSSTPKNTEGLAILGEYYFDSFRNEYQYPGNRLAGDWDESNLLPFIHKYFNSENIWFPPTKLREEFEGDISNQTNTKDCNNIDNKELVKADNHLFANQSFGQSIKMSNSCYFGDQFSEFSWYSSGNSPFAVDIAIYKGTSINNPIYTQKDIKLTPANRGGIKTVVLKGGGDKLNFNKDETYTFILTMKYGNQIVHISSDATDGNAYINTGFKNNLDLKFKLVTK